MNGFAQNALFARLVQRCVRKIEKIDPADLIVHIVENGRGPCVLNAGGFNMIRYGFIAFLVLAAGMSSAAPRMVLGEEVTNTG
jgi:hypothetical protein